MKTALALILALLLTLAAPAGAKIVVVDASGTVVATPVRDDFTHVLGWTDDGSALLVRRPDGRALRIELASGGVARQPLLDAAVSVGPGGRSIVASGGDEKPRRDNDEQPVRVELRDRDGRVLDAEVVASYVSKPWVAWSRDGSRVAVAASPTLLVFDAASGAVLQHVAFSWVMLDAQAFSPDASALAVTANKSVWRIDLASGGQSLLFRPKEPMGLPLAAWSPDGRIAVTAGDRIAVLGASPGAARVTFVDPTPARWTPDGSALFYLSAVETARCQPARYDVELLVPGDARRTMLAPTAAEVRSADWSPDGRALAIDLGPEPVERGKRHPWPNSIRRGYGMFTSRGDAAIRRIVVRASRALRRGADRAQTMRLVSADYRRVRKRFDETDDTVVGEVLAGELSKWLRAAGFAGIDARDELEC